MKIRLLHTILLLSTYLTAQNSPYSWRNYTTNDGLPSPEVYTVIQDSKGYLWFGTDNGVSRFDGYAFQNFGAKEGLADNVINGIQEDAEGRIWFGSMWGKLYYFQNDSIYPFKFNPIIERYQHLFTLVNGFCRFENKQNAKFNAQNPTSDIQNPTLSFSRNTEGGVLLGLSGLGIFKITDDGRHELIAAPQTPAVLYFEAKEKNVVVAQTRSRNGGQMNPQKQQLLFKYDGQKLTQQGIIEQLLPKENANNARLKAEGTRIYVFSTSNIHRIEGHKQDASLFYDHAIFDILTDEDGLTWTAEGANGGVKAYKNIESIGTTTPQMLLKGVSAVSMLRDRDGGYWVTTIEKGVFYLRDKKVQLFTPQNTAFPFEVVSAVENIGQNKVIIGFWQGEVGVFDAETKAYQKISKLRVNNLFDIKWDAVHQKLFFGGDDTQLHIWQKGHVAFLPARGVKKIALRLNKDAAWVLGYSDIYQINGLESSQNLAKTNFASVRNRIFSIFEDRQNRLWASKQDGLYQLMGDTLIKVPTIHKALQTRIESMAELPNGSLVFATKGNGLVIWDGTNAVNLTKNDGLTTDMLENVTTDAKSTIWVGTLAGLHKIYQMPTGQWHVQPITLFHGLPTNDINDVAPTSDSRQQTLSFSRNTEGVFLATPKGLVFYRDTTTQMASRSPFLAHFKATERAIDASRPISLAADDNNIALTWQLVNCTMFGKIPYRYRLNPNAAWRLTQNRTVELASLSAGNYVFEVQAQNEDNVWSDALKVPFLIRPHWYETAWFRLLLLVAAFLMGYFLYKNRLATIKQEHATALQINDLERTALAAQMNPHFIFNCLNSIQLLIHKGEKDNAMRYLAHFAKLVRSTLESTRQGKISVEEEAKALEHYLSLEKLRFKEGLTYTIDIDSEIDTFDIELPAMLVQPFVENALKHGLSTAQIAAHISVHFKQESPNTLVVDVTDNGKGFDKNAQNNPSKALYTEGGRNREAVNEEIKKTGVGIALARKRLILLNGRDNGDDLMIESIVNDKGESVGTHVRLVILRV